MIKSKNNKYKKFSKKKIVLVILTALIVVIGVIFVLESTNTTSFIKKSNKPLDDKESSKTTSTAPSAQSDFTDGDPNKEPGNTLQENRGSAVIEENNDTPIENPNPIKSEDGEITVYSPIKDSVIKSGTTLSGISKLDKVEYRIIDSVSGVIATGTLNVNNGKFSGKINFSTNADQGRIDLFATKPDFSEYSNIEIPIRFKN